MNIASRISPIKLVRRLRDFTLPGQALILLVAVLTAGSASSWQAQRYLSSLIIRKALAEQMLQIKADVDNFEVTLSEAETSISQFAGLISQLNPSGPGSSNAAAIFEHLVRLDPDGAWRSRRDRFKPRDQAGIWVPSYVPITEQTKVFFGLAQPVTSLFGLGVSSYVLENTWVLPLSGGELIFWPGKPEFIRHAGPDLDYRDTPWVELTSPAVNPHRRPQWTRPDYDPAAREWLISVVAPFQQGGRWGGSVGHDLLLRDLLRWLLPINRTSQGGLMAQPLYVVAADGRLIVDGSGRPSSIRLPAAHRRVLDNAPDGQRVFPLDLGDQKLIVAALPRLDAKAVYQADSKALADLFTRELSGLQFGMTLFLALILLVGLLIVRREGRFRHRERMLLEDRNRDLEALVLTRTQELAEANRELLLQAREDSLTGIGNRRSFDRSLNLAWAEARRRQEELALIMIDVDHFKLYNDTLGHPAGDACLRDVATELRRHLRRPEDQIFRYGGEEFVVLLAKTDAAGARHCAETLRQAIVDRQLPHPQGMVTISLGIAMASPSQQHQEGDGTTLVARADTALYRAKQEGRNRVAMAGDDASEAAHQL
jgi:diguanylate cyclase (GGDEF)-like protein